MILAIASTAPVTPPSKSPWCSNCGARMNLVDEVHDNDYLTPAQDTEERINSIDYDVWLCPDCGETEILPYVQRSSDYTECPRCHARACRMVSDRVMRRPTVSTAASGTHVASWNAEPGMNAYSTATTPGVYIIHLPDGTSAKINGFGPRDAQTDCKHRGHRGAYLPVCSLSSFLSSELFYSQTRTTSSIFLTEHPPKSDSKKN